MATQTGPAERPRQAGAKANLLNMADELRDDIAAARSKMRVKGGGREMKKLVECLWDGEVVARMTTGYYGNGTGLLVLTDRRLLFVKDGMMAKTTEDFPLSKVSSIQWSSGMVLGTIISLRAGTRPQSRT